MIVLFKINYLKFNKKVLFVIGKILIQVINRVFEILAKYNNKIKNFIYFYLEIK